MSTELVQIGKKDKQVSRRNFLKVLGATTAATVATGCADPHEETILPNLRKQEHQVPGVAVWYSSTCRECSAGCGIQVRTREGRAVKVEGNPNHPINRGGLCGLGQSSLQALYDPDRVREPLQKTIDTVTNKVVFKPIAWNDALAKVAGALVEPGKKKFLITGESNGTLDNLINDFSKGFGADRITYEPMDEVALAKATEAVYGVYGIPSYKFDRSEVVVSFGADFLETWISPCEFARDWATKRKSSKPQMVFQVEPRMSLTGAKADKWVSVNPGTEVRVALAVLKKLFALGHGKSLDAETNSKLAKLTREIDFDSVAKESGVSVEKILLMATRLSEASESLVVAGGAQGSSSSEEGLQVACAFINLILGNVGKTVQLSRMRKPKTSIAGIASAIKDIEARKASIVMFHRTNPVFTLPSAYSLHIALEKVQPGLVVSFSSHLDETTALADIILPVHHDLEDWGDHAPFEGVRGLLQPTMHPVFNTQSFGDLLLTLAAAVDKKEITGGHKKFKDYLKASWEKFYGTLGKAGDFGSFWRQCVENGGYFSDSRNGITPNTSAKAFEVNFDAGKLVSKSSNEDISLVPFFSVQSFDGRAANRPWLQELPDPLSLVVWDTWGEIHPETAKKLSLKTGDVAKVQNYFGELNIPVIVTEQVRVGTIAVPIGQGHHEYGRFAKSIGGGNIYTLLAPTENGSDGLSFISSKVSVSSSPYRNKVVRSQITQDQLGRDIAQTQFLAPDGSKIEKKGHHGHHGHGKPKQMYEQRKHPLYQWGMTIDLAACTGCSACIVACYAENNIAVVGKEMVSYGREMSWIQIHNYVEGEGEELTVSLQPMMCQQCQNAPCEPVCPVYATYHNEEGLNAMVYNRCVGTRYCSNNCTYKVRRFNWVEFDLPETYQWQLNPDVTRRTVGIMEKCTFCVQRINEAKDKAKDQGRTVQDGEVKPACVQSCPTQALTFGNLKDPSSKVSQLAADKRGYKVIDAFVNTQPSITYLKDIKYKV